MDEKQRTGAELILAIHAAYDADKAFQQAVEDAGFKSRWDVPNGFEGVAYQVARESKITADRAMHEAFEASRRAPKEIAKAR